MLTGRPSGRAGAIAPAARPAAGAGHRGEQRGDRHLPERALPGREIEISRHGGYGTAFTPASTSGARCRGAAHGLSGSLPDGDYIVWETRNRRRHMLVAEASVAVFRLD